MIREVGKSFHPKMSIYICLRRKLGKFTKCDEVMTRKFKEIEGISNQQKF